jgi:hypothetical protein
MLYPYSLLANHSLIPAITGIPVPVFTPDSESNKKFDLSVVSRLLTLLLVCGCIMMFLVFKSREKLHENLK